jgi:Cu-processing system permease protein
MSRSALLAIFTQTFKETIKSKMLIMFAAIFFFLAFNLPLATLAAFNYLPQNYMPSFISSIITVSFPLIPLLPLPIGAISIVEERESGVLQYVLSMPLSRTMYLLGRLTGLFAATTSIVILGFGIAAVIAFRYSPSFLSIWYVTLSSCVLNASMLGVAFLVSILCKKKMTALTSAIFIWFLFTVIADASVLAPVMAEVNRMDLFVPIILLNPVESSRLLATSQIAKSIIDLGPTGMAMNYLFGSASTTVLEISLFCWIAATISIAFAIFQRQDIR